MPTSTPYPNGQTLVSSALTVAQINAIIQPMTCGMIGINPPDYSVVRVDWQTEGQPFIARPDVDVCFISCVPENVDYRLVRDRTFSGTGPVVETWMYTRGWRVNWVLYGPNSTDRARAIHSAFFMDYFNDLLSLQQLYPVSDFAEPTRIPEQTNAQWFDRSDFSVVMYEQITETISDGAVISVENKVFTEDGLLADVTTNE